MGEQGAISLIPVLITALSFLGGAYGIVQGTKALLEAIDKHLRTKRQEQRRKERLLRIQRRTNNALTKFRRKDTPKQWQRTVEATIQGWQGKTPRSNPCTQHQKE